MVRFFIGRNMLAGLFNGQLRSGYFRAGHSDPSGMEAEFDLIKSIMELVNQGNNLPM